VETGVARVTSLPKLLVATASLLIGVSCSETHNSPTPPVLREWTSVVLLQAGTPEYFSGQAGSPVACFEGELVVSIVSDGGVLGARFPRRLIADGQVECATYQHLVSSNTFASVTDASGHEMPLETLSKVLRRAGDRARWVTVDQ